MDSPEVSVAKTSIERKEVLFNAVAHIENYPDLALFGSVILDTDIPVEKMATSGNFKYELTYHTYDFGSGEDIEIYDESKTLSDKEWNAMFQQGVPTIDNFDKPEELLTAIYTDGDEPTDIYRKKL